MEESEKAKTNEKPMLAANSILTAIELKEKLRTNSDEKKNKPPITDPNDPNYRLSVADFQKLNSLGKGAYAEVALVKRISNGKLFALKVVDLNFMRKVYIYISGEYQIRKGKNINLQLKRKCLNT